MRIKELVMDNKELLALLSILIGVGGAAKIAGDVSTALASVTTTAPQRIDTLGVLSSDVRQLKQDVSTLRSDVQAMLRAQCVTNPTRWEVYETAGIRCGDMIPSATQAGRVRR